MINKKDEDTTTGTTGILGKFRERLNRIRKERMLRKHKNKEEQDKFIKEKTKEIREELSRPTSNFPRKPKKVIVKQNKYKKASYKKEKINKTKKTNNEIKEEIIKAKVGINKNKEEQDINNNKSTSNESILNQQSNEEQVIKNKKTIFDEVDKKEENFKEEKDKKNIAPNTNLKKEEPKSIPKGISSNTNKETDNFQSLSDDKYKEQLKSKIITRFKKDFSKSIGELAILEEELNNIKEKNNIEIELEKIKDLKKEINSIIKRINSIITEYNIYSSNYELENAINLKDSLLIDDIIEYKYILDNYKSNQEIVKEYKLLDEFKNLYQKLDNIKELSNELIENNQSKIDELEEKEIIHKEVKIDIKDVNDIMNSCNDEITNQNKYLNELMSKINDINKEEITHLKFKSLNKVFNSSFLFVSSLSLTKKLPIIPRIFINTLASYNLLKNIYNSMTPERITEIKYSAINYDNEILSKMNDINYTEHLISDTLTTINNIKSKFLLQYNSQLPGYEETLNKILSIEDNVLQNQSKIDTIKNKLSKSRKQNNEKMLKLENYKKNSQIN